MMKKIPSLFKRDYDGNRQVIDEVVPGCEWVIAGEGVPTLKMDGTSCMAKDGALYKRYDRKMKRGKRKAAPEGWIACEENPDEHTAHWPGWAPVSDTAPEDRYHREALSMWYGAIEDDTYELVGPMVQSNPYDYATHRLMPHGEITLSGIEGVVAFDKMRDFFNIHIIEGIVWHHPDGRMCKIKRRDFGLQWPPKKAGE